MEANRLSVMVDLDDTLANTTYRIHEVFKEKIGDFGLPRIALDYQSMFPHISSKDISRLIWEDWKDTVFKAEQIEPIDGAIDFLWNLRDEGCDIIIASANLTNTYVKDWVKLWIPEGVVKTVCLGWNKWEQPYDVMIDDDIRFLEPWLKQNKVGILFERLWNKEEKKKVIWSSASYDGILEIIQSQKKRLLKIKQESLRRI
jgi:5'(3')-deoxyribonucleotidase